MKKYIIGYRNCYTICSNYGGWVIVSELANGCILEPERYIYKTKNSAINAVKKILDGTNKNEPKILRKMTDEEFINALNFDTDT
jgi:hypothetical protein